MFLKFQSQEERRQYGGSCFFELQFCRSLREQSMEIILKQIRNWEDDSLYVHGDKPLYSVYGPIFGNGVHPNMTEGYLDPWGITYYKPDMIDGIIVRALQSKPEGYKMLIEWLNKAKEYNGFYILGV
ncbi:MAG: hypothetical protein GXY08_03305 [Ruminococcus sp.]|nr:hypothetical protein [Ruminococcus sp.]